MPVVKPSDWYAQVTAAPDNATMNERLPGISSPPYAPPRPYAALAWLQGAPCVAQGWQCPICKGVMAPTTPSCIRCP